MGIALGVDPATVFGEKRAFGDLIQTGKKSQPFVEDVTHHVTMTSGAEKLQGQKRTKAQLRQGSSLIRVIPLQGAL